MTHPAEARALSMNLGDVVGKIPRRKPNGELNEASLKVEEEESVGPSG